MASRYNGGRSPGIKSNPGRRVCSVRLIPVILLLLLAAAASAAAVTAGVCHQLIDRLLGASGGKGLLAPSAAPFHGVDAWNQGRIHLENGRLSHYLNGIRVVDVQMDSPRWREALAASKFAARAGFCASPRGHIVLQDHGDLTRFRNVRIRSLDPSTDDS